MIDTGKIKQLREATGLSFGEINKALSETGGDESKALEILKARAAEIAAKKSTREAKEGIVDSYIHTTKKVGSMVEVFCETDFVARNSEFQKLARELAMHIAAMKPKDSEELLGQPFIRDENLTVAGLIEQYVAKLGENIRVGKFEVFEI